MRAASAPHDRAGFHAADGVLLIVREPPPPLPPAPGQPPSVPANLAEGVELLVAVFDDGSVCGLAGHVDLGTGIRTALTQLVAEELDVAFERVTMLLGDTARAPNQGPTIASASLQIHAAPLRQAAATARAWLLARAAERLRVNLATLQVADGVVSSHDGADSTAVGRIGYGELVAGEHVELTLDPKSSLKPPTEWRIAGQPLPRVDIPGKVTGEAVFVHDVRMPGMLHGRVLRPPYAGADHGDFIGRTLRAVQRDSVAHLPGLVAVVVEGDFVGVVAEREEHAEQAMRELRVDWGDWPAQPPLADLAAALSANPATPRVVAEQGDAAAANAAAAQRLQRRYVWPYQMHASIGPSCAVAHWLAEAPGGQGARLTVWAGTQNPHVLRADLALLTGLPDLAVDVIRLEAAGCYGRNGADDVAADAALLSRAVGAPVRVQLTREQEHQWEPKGAAQWMEVDGSLDAAGRLAAWDFSTSYPSNAAPTLALLLTGRVPARATAYAMGDRTSVPPYRVPNLKVTIQDMPPILRASWLRGVSALPNSFAHESFVDEMAEAAGADPVAFRLQHLDDARAAELLCATAERAGWQPHGGARRQPVAGSGERIAKGQGVAWARYVHSKFPGFGAAWAAWVADVEVNRVTGEVHVGRIVVGHDAGAMVNPAGVKHQVHGNVVQTTSRALKEQVRVEPSRGVVADREWGSYPILTFREVPTIEVLLMPRPGEPMLGAGESSSVPGTAAIANAIYDATGVRFRQPPFTPEVVRAALNPLPGPGAEAAAPAPAGSAGTDLPAVAELAKPRPIEHPPTAPWPRRRSLGAMAVGVLTGVVSATAALVGWRVHAPIAPVSPSNASIYTAATLERGRVLAALGNCVGCHTAPGGPPGAGGRALETPFGTVYSTNLTPDAASGIGAWSFSAFQRAMREGIARDGRHLYPAFPYPAYARVGDDDLMALYAWLMAQPVVAQRAPETALRFPFNLRPLMAVWNGLHLAPATAVATTSDASRSVLWQRGEWLVNGLGHCSSCHTPRDALGAERQGQAFLSGAFVDGWHAPALSAAAPRPWTEDELFHYLRHGYSERHGAATGPMAPVVRALAPVPDGELRAMAHYLASFHTPMDDVQAQTAADAAIDHARATAALPDAAQRLFEGACGACHGEGRAPVELGLNLPLALSSKLRSEHPDNLLRVVLDGVRDPAGERLGFMASFRDAFDDRQLAELAAWMRRRYAPDLPPWSGLEQAAARLRAAPVAH